MCIEYYFRDSANGNTCNKCPNNCKDCTDANTCKATKCDPYYYVDGANGCKNCPSKCKTCSSSACQACDDGYFADGNTCAKCGANCKTCAKLNECNSDGCTNMTSFVFLTATKTCATKVSCPDNEYDVLNVCTACGDKCLKCSSATACETCMDKHGMKSGEN